MPSRTYQIITNAGLLHFLGGWHKLNIKMESLQQLLKDTKKAHKLRERLIAYEINANSSSDKQAELKVDSYLAWRK